MQAQPELARPTPPVDDWELDPAEIAFQGKIASGAFGDLYKGAYCGQEVAIKIVRNVQDNTQQFQEFLQVSAPVPDQPCASSYCVCTHCTCNKPYLTCMLAVSCRNSLWSGTLEDYRTVGSMMAHLVGLSPHTYGGLKHPYI